MIKIVINKSFTANFLNHLICGFDMMIPIPALCFHTKKRGADLFSFSFLSEPGGIN